MSGRVVGAVHCLASVEFVLHAACREAVLTRHLIRTVERCGAHAGHAEWTLSPMRYYPTPVPTDPELGWRRRDLLVLHPLCQRVAITDEEIAYRAQQMKAAPVDEATWAFTVWADVRVAG